MDTAGWVMDTGWVMGPAGWVADTAWVMDTVEDLGGTVPWDTVLSPVILAGGSTLFRSKDPDKSI